MSRFLAAFFLFATVACAEADTITLREIRVIDGDTIDARGHRYRLTPYDTPEMGRRSRCDLERQLGSRATTRLKELLETGPLDLTEIPCTCDPRKPVCNYGRLCGVLTVKGENVGAILIREKLAVPYVCEKRCPPMHDWCGETNPR